MANKLDLSRFFMVFVPTYPTFVIYAPRAVYVPLHSFLLTVFAHLSQLIIYILERKVGNSTTNVTVDYDYRPTVVM